MCCSRPGPTRNSAARTLHHATWTSRCTAIPCTWTTARSSSAATSSSLRCGPGHDRGQGRTHWHALPREDLEGTMTQPEGSTTSLEAGAAIAAGEGKDDFGIIETRGIDMIPDIERKSKPFE